MMLHPKSDEVRKSMFETLCHTVVAVSVVLGSTLLAAQRVIDATSWAGAAATAIAASGAVTVVRRSEVDRKTEPPPRPTVILERREEET